MPYKDFTVGYPPFALIFFLIPSIFTSDLNTYVVLFGAEMVILALIALYFMLKLAEKAKMNKYAVTILYMAFILIYFNQMIKKFDIAVMMLTIISIYMFCEKRYVSSYAMMTIAVFTKVYPIFLIPVLVIMNLTNKDDPKRKKNALRGLTTFVVIMAMPVLIFLLMDGSFDSLISLLYSQSDRGFQVESIIGVIIQCLGDLKFTTVNIVPSCETYDVISPISNSIIKIWPILFIGAILIIYALIYNHARKNRLTSTYREDLRNIAMYSTAVLIIFILVNKVFSTQYIIWLYPLLPFLIVIDDKKANISIAVLSVVVVVLSSLIVKIGTFGDTFVIVNIIRDIMLFAILSQIILHLVNRKNQFDSLYSDQTHN